ncbi:MAG: DUF1801 domain-containing protein [Actinobacteria bacterium]|nr:DUF1801 domain-containing protein [Actinomycetota bacterium]
MAEKSTKSGFTPEERAAMKERAKELKAAETAAESLKDVLAKIAESTGTDREIGTRLHEIITTAAPELMPKTWYGSPAYYKDGKVIVFFQPASKFKVRYLTLGFNEDAKLDDGDMWATSFAITKLSKADEERVAALVKKAAG